jgi:hypothetical protein
MGHARVQQPGAARVDWDVYHRVGSYARYTVPEHEMF